VTNTSGIIEFFNMKDTLRVFSITLLMLLNFFLSESSILGTLFVIIQFLLVLVLLLKRNNDYAFFLHIIFVVSSLNFTILEDAGGTLLSTYSYSKLRVFGKIPVSFLFTFYFGISSPWKRGSNSLLNLFLRHYSILVFVAIIFGIYGLFKHDYSLNYFIDSLYYSLVIIFISMKLRNSLNFNFYFFIKRNVFLVLMASPISSTILFLLGQSAFYGGIDIIPVNSIFMFTPLLFFIKVRSNFFLQVIACISLIFVAAYGIGGKGVIFLFLLLLVWLIRYFIVSRRKIIPFLFISLFSIFFVFILNKGFLIEGRNEYLFAHKANQFISMFNFHKLSLEALDEVSDSPKVRIAEVLIILNNYTNNPMASLFGMGFGGFFRDNLGLFALMDLSQGSFDDEQINSGRFYRGHDTIPVIMLLHGFVGIIFLLYWIVKILFSSIKSFSFIGVLPWLLLTYGFDINIAIFGLLFFFIASFEFYMYESSTNFVRQ
jgi:hypothetical protein